MVKILKSNDGNRTGIYDEANKRFVCWSNWEWNIKPDSTDYNASMFIGDGSVDEKKTLAFLLKIDQMKNSLPISLHSNDRVESGRDYTDVEIGDACRVPADEFWFTEFTVDGTKQYGQLFFQENTTPWFSGDGHDFPNREYIKDLDVEKPKFKLESWDHCTLAEKRERWLKYDAYIPSKWHELEGDELKAFYGSTIVRLIADLKLSINAKEAKQKRETAELDNALASIPESVKDKFLDYVKANKLKGVKLTGLVELINAVK